MARRRIRHRSHDGWLDLVRHDPSVSLTMRATAEMMFDHATWRDYRTNRYAITREAMAKWLRIKHPENARKRIKTLRDAGWLVICTPGHNGQQQVYHRSVPWDPVWLWNNHPCEVCLWWYARDDRAARRIAFQAGQTSE